MAPVLGIDVRLLRWSTKAREALADQWGGVARHEVAHWDWCDVFSRYRDPRSFDLALWTAEGRLCALGLATLENTSVTFRFAEGDPRPDCPYRGKRLPVLAEAVALYGQKTGRTEMRIEPANPALENLYVSVYGFERKAPKGGKPFFWRRI